MCGRAGSHRGEEKCHLKAELLALDCRDCENKAEWELCSLSLEYISSNKTKKKGGGSGGRRTQVLLASFPWLFLLNLNKSVFSMFTITHLDQNIQRPPRVNAELSSAYVLLRYHCIILQPPLNRIFKKIISSTPAILWRNPRLADAFLSCFCFYYIQERFKILNSRDIRMVIFPTPGISTYQQQCRKLCNTILNYAQTVLRLEIYPEVCCAGQTEEI